jgi:predicted phosphodiesterase
MDRRNFLQSSAIVMMVSLGAIAAQPVPPAPTSQPFNFAATPVLLNPADDSITVIALPNALATGWVEYGPTEALGQRADGASRGQLPLSDRLLAFRLASLKPGEKYFYRVHLKPINFKTAYSVKPGEEIHSDIHSFRTFNPAAESATFTVWNDTHEHAPTLMQLSAALNANPTDFLLWNGDISNDVRDESKIISQFLAPANQPFAADVPLFFARGNHDVRGRDARSLPNYITGPGGEYFYTFRHGPLAAIVLDSGEDKPDNLPVYVGLNSFDAYRALQRAFLEKAIIAPAFTSAPFRIVFVHIPLFWDAEVPKDWPGVWGKDIDGKIINGWICEDGRAKWHDLLVKGKIDLVISGHEHKHAYFPPNEKHPYGQLVGGGPKPAEATSIVGAVTRTEMTLVIKNLDGKPLIQQTFKPQR